MAVILNFQDRKAKRDAASLPSESETWRAQQRIDDDYAALIEKLQPSRPEGSKAASTPLQEINPKKLREIAYGSERLSTPSSAGTVINLSKARLTPCLVESPASKISKTDSN